MNFQAIFSSVAEADSDSLLESMNDPTASPTLQVSDYFLKTSKLMVEIDLNPSFGFNWKIS